MERVLRSFFPANSDEHFIVERKLDWRYCSPMQRFGRYTLGTGLCVSAAGLCTLLLRESTVRGFLPFLFIGIVIAVAMRFGSAAGILGTIGAAMIFAEFLFQPVLNVRVGDTTERSNLIWMIIGGISASELVGIHPKKPSRGDDPQGTSGI